MMELKLTELPDEFVAEEARMAAELAAAHLDLEARRTAIAAEEKRLAQERENLARQREALAAQQAEIAALRLQMAPPSPSHSTAGEAAESPDHPVASADPHSPEPHSHPSDDDVFARLRALSLLREPEDTSAQDTPPPRSESQQPSATTEPAKCPTAPALAQQVGVEHHDEESIDDYMAQLFARLNGARSTVTPSTVTPSIVAPEVAPPSAPADLPLEEMDLEHDEPSAFVAAGAAEPAAAAPCWPPLENLPQPRRAAPEHEVNLSAMRELANLSAVSAIGASQYKKWSSSAAIKLGAAGMLGLIGAALLWLSKSGWLANSSVTLFGFGAVLFVAGILWLLQGLGLLLMAWNVGQPSAGAAPNQPPDASTRRD